MLLLKKTIPLIITFITGMIMIIAFFSGEGLPTIKSLEKTLPIWIQIIMTFTMVLGAFSLLKINIQKIAKKADGWGYSIVLLVGFFSMSILGFIGGGWPGDESYAKDSVMYAVSDDGLSNAAVKVVAPIAEDGTIKPTKEGKITVIFTENPDGTPLAKDAKSEPTVVSADIVKTKTMATLKNWEQFMFHGIFKNAQSTMFSLLAFFVASASFRAFRIKSKEAALLMISAFIVMLGNVPLGNIFMSIPGIGQYLDLAAFKDWLMAYPSSAAQSAIVIGAMLGYMTSSLKIIFGIERSHLGGD